MPTKKIYASSSAEDHLAKINLEITSSLIKFKFSQKVSAEEPFNVTTDIELPFTAIQDVPRIASNTLIAVSQVYKSDKNVKTINYRSLFNVSELTKPQRYRMPLTSKLYGSEPIPNLYIFVKDLSKGFEDCDIIIFSPTNNLEFNAAADFTPITSLTELNQLDLLDSITLEKDDSYINDEYIKIKVITEPYVNTVYIEPIQGIIDAVRVNIDETGVGSFRVLKSSVEPGNSIRVSAGFKFYTGIANLSLPV